MNNGYGQVANFVYPNEVVNKQPTWIDNLSEVTIKQCSGSLIEINAKLSINCDPNITWQHARTASGPWTAVTPQTDRVNITIDATSVLHQSTISLRISPADLNDSGYYRIKVSVSSDEACASMPDVYSNVAHITLDTVPMFKVDATSKSYIMGRRGLRAGESTTFYTMVVSPPADVNADCPGGTGKAQTATWYLMKPVGDGTYETAVELDYFNEPDNNISQTPTSDNGKTYRMDVTNARGNLNNTKIFMKVQNCCGVSYTDTITLTVVDNLRIEAQTNDTVCEESMARLTVTAGLNINAANKRRWQYSKDGNTWKDVIGDALFLGATDKMENNVAVLTIPNAKYALNGYKFRLGLTDAFTVWSDVSLGEVMTLMVKPVTNLKIFVTADPNPVPQDVNNVFNFTEFRAGVAIVTPGDTTYLTKEQIGLFGYTNFDWYQIRKDKVTRLADVDGFTDDDGNPHDSVFILEHLKYGTHDSTLYFAVLRHICFDLLDPENPENPCADCYGKASDTALLRMYSDLHVEWKTDKWKQWIAEQQQQPNSTWSADKPWLPAGTTTDDLQNYPNLPTGTIIPLEPTEWDMDGEHDHRMSFAYYIFCDDGENEIFLDLELLKGVMSQQSRDIAITREWQYSPDRGMTWYLMDYAGNGVADITSPLVPSASRFESESHRDEFSPKNLNGVWLRFIARAQPMIQMDTDGNPLYETLSDGTLAPMRKVIGYDETDAPIYEYVYNDTSRILEIVVSKLPATQERYTVNVRSDNVEMGTVSISGNGVYDKGAEVTITATAKSGYRFVEWKNGTNVFSNQAVYTFNATENLVLTAYFEAVPLPPQPTQYTILVRSNNTLWGEVSISGNSPYTENTDVTISAIAKVGYRFVHWKNGDVVFGMKADTTFKTTENLTLTAYFEAIPLPPQPTQYTISVQSNNTNWGTVTISGNGIYEENTDVTISATAKEGYRFVHWKNGDVVFGIKADTTFKTTENLTLTAYFEAIPLPPQPTQYTISVQSNNTNWGTVTISGNGIYEENTDVTISATAKEGYRFVHWKNGDVVFGIKADTIFKAVENLTLTAYFEAIPCYTVNVMSGNTEMGSVSISGNGTYQEGTEVTIVASPKAGCRFVNWKRGNTVFSDQAVHVFNVSESLTLVAYFEQMADNEDSRLCKTFVYVKNRVIYLSEPMGKVQVFDVFGRCVYSGTATNIPVSTKGMYILTVRGKNIKVLIP